MSIVLDSSQVRLHELRKRCAPCFEAGVHFLVLAERPLSSAACAAAAAGDSSTAPGIATRRRMTRFFFGRQLCKGYSRFGEPRHFAFMPLVGLTSAARLGFLALEGNPAPVVLGEWGREKAGGREQVPDRKQERRHYQLEHSELGLSAAHEQHDEQQQQQKYQQEL